MDTGNPDFFVSRGLARDSGVDLPEEGKNTEIPSPTGVRIGGMSIHFAGVKSTVLSEPAWLSGTMHNDASMPSTVLKNYEVVFDYTKRVLTIGRPGSLKPRGQRIPAGIHPKTGIVQIDAVIGGDSLSFALDNGASYSFVSGEILERLCKKHPDWPRNTGAVGCANIWGWWPDEPSWPDIGHWRRNRNGAERPWGGAGTGLP